MPGGHKPVNVPSMQSVRRKGDKAAGRQLHSAHIERRRI